MQRVGSDDEREQVDAVLGGVPAAVVHAAELLEHVDQVHAAHVQHAVLAVGGEDVVLRGQRPGGADLRGLLAQARGEQAQLALALQRGGLGVEPAGEHHVGPQAAQGLGIQVGDPVVVPGVGDARALRCEELDGLDLATGVGAGVDADVWLGHAEVLPAGPRIRGRVRR